MSEHPIPVCWAIEREAELRDLAWRRELGRRAGYQYGVSLRRATAAMQGFVEALRTLGGATSPSERVSER